jgi:hypothetical protein
LCKDYLKGLKDELDGKMSVVTERPYEGTDSTVDSQIIKIDQVVDAARQGDSACWRRYRVCRHARRPRCLAEGDEEEA